MRGCELNEDLTILLKQCYGPDNISLALNNRCVFHGDYKSAQYSEQVSCSKIFRRGSISSLLKRTVGNSSKPTRQLLKEFYSFRSSK